MNKFNKFNWINCSVFYFCLFTIYKYCLFTIFFFCIYIYFFLHWLICFHLFIYLFVIFISWFFYTIYFSIDVCSLCRFRALTLFLLHSILLSFDFLFLFWNWNCSLYIHFSHSLLFVLEKCSRVSIECMDNELNDINKEWKNERQAKKIPVCTATVFVYVSVDVVVCLVFSSNLLYREKERFLNSYVTII